MLSATIENYMYNGDKLVVWEALGNEISIHHDITEILLSLVLNTDQPINQSIVSNHWYTDYCFVWNQMWIQTSKCL